MITSKFKTVHSRPYGLSLRYPVDNRASFYTQQDVESFLKNMNSKVLLRSVWKHLTLKIKISASAGSFLSSFLFLRKKKKLKREDLMLSERFHFESKYQI